jgi:hypothetical protein
MSSAEPKLLDKKTVKVSSKPSIVNEDAKKERTTTYKEDAAETQIANRLHTKFKDGGTKFREKMSGDFKNFSEGIFQEQIDDHERQDRINANVEERLVYEEVWGDPQEHKKERALLKERKRRGSDIFKGIRVEP